MLHLQDVVVPVPHIEVVVVAVVVDIVVEAAAVVAAFLVAAVEEVVVDTAVEAITAMTTTLHMVLQVKIPIQPVLLYHPQAHLIQVPVEVVP